MDGNDKNLKLYMAFLWVGVVSLFAFGSIVVVFFDAIEKNKVLSLVVVIFLLPGTISYISLILDILKEYKFKILLFAPIVFFPKAFVVAALVGPVIYLVWTTYRVSKLSGFAR